MSIEIKIEKNIPMPSFRKAGQWTALLREMDATDSFFVPCEDARRSTIAKSICGAARRIDIPVATRQVEGGVRAWRLRDPDAK